MKTRIALFLLGAGLTGLSPSAAPHGRPPMLWVIDSMHATKLAILNKYEEGQGLGINNLGTVVGWAKYPATGTRHAFARDVSGVTTDIGTHVPQQHSTATDINENSEVVGYRTTSGHAKAFFWSPLQGFVNLSNTNPDGVENPRDFFALALNNNGRIVGWAEADSYQYDSDAVSWWYHGADPYVIAVAPTGRANYAWDVSDNGWFAGEEFAYFTYDNYGFRMRNGIVSYPVDPSSANRAEYVFGVNEAGTVVGTSAWPSGQRATKWRVNGDPLILGVLPGGNDSEAYDINEQDFVVGYSRTIIDGESGKRAFLFHFELGMVALPLPNAFPDTAATQCSANALTDRQPNGLIQIAGHCSLEGKDKVVRWDVYVGEVPAP